MFVTFKNSNKIGVFSYEPKRIAQSLLKLNIEESNLITLTDLPVSNLHSAHSFLALEHQEPNEDLQFSIFENTLGTKFSSAGGDNKSDQQGSGNKKKSGWSLSDLRIFVVPLLIMGLLCYNFCGGSDKPSNA